VDQPPFAILPQPAETSPSLWDETLVDAQGTFHALGVTGRFRRQIESSPHLSVYLLEIVQCLLWMLSDAIYAEAEGGGDKGGDLAAGYASLPEVEVVLQHFLWVRGKGSSASPCHIYIPA